VIHLAAVVAEAGEATFQAVNVEGTRNVVREAEHAGVPRFVYVSSLGAERGVSPYHRSKREGEKIVLDSSLNATVVRLANVYGPGDEVISLLIKMIRMLPVVPTIDGGEDVFQPVWVGDAACALANCVERADLGGVALDVAGPDRTCMNDLIHRMRDITGRTPLTVPVTGGIAVLGAKFASLAGVDIPLDRGQITMLEEGNVIQEPGENALTKTLGVKCTPLDEGLNKLADALPEQLPDQGVGGMRRKRIWADIEGSHMSPEALFARFRETFSDVTPWSMDVGSEPGTPTTLREGETMTMKLPVRGNVQVRVEELTPRTVTLVTLEGHPLAGAVRFLAEQRGDRLRFEVQVYDRAADVADWLVMRTVGQYIQLGTWRSIVERVVRESGGTCVDEIHHEITALDDAQATHVQRWLGELVVERKRESAFDDVPSHRGDATA
jgi:NADH dehydrogenase